MSQLEIFDFIAKSVTEILDEHNPLNKSGLLSKRIYAFTLSKATQKMVEAKKLAYNAFSTAQRKKHAPTEIEILKHQYHVIRNACNIAVRKEKNKFRSNIF